MHPKHYYPYLSYYVSRLQSSFPGRICRLSPGLFLVDGQYLEVELNFSRVQACLIFTPSSLLGSLISDLNYFTGDGIFCPFGGVYKEIDKEETRWQCEQFTISFKIFKGSNLVQIFGHLDSNLNLKTRFVTCNISNVIHGI